MTGVKIPARDIIVQVKDPAQTNTWVQIHQLTSATLNRGENEETAETTTFDSNGEYEEVVMQRGATCELEGFLRKDKTTGARDEGQKVVDAWASTTGVSSVGQVRTRHPMDTDWEEWDATCRQGEEGGETNDMTGWEASFTRCGPKRKVPVTPPANGGS